MLLKYPLGTVLSKGWRVISPSPPLSAKNGKIEKNEEKKCGHISVNFVQDKNKTK